MCCCKGPKVFISAYGIQIPSLLDLGSEVMLLRQSYFNQHLLPKIKVALSEKAEAHQLFHPTVNNDGQLPVKLHNKLDITFLGLKVPNVGVLVVEDLSQVLDKKHQSKLPGIGGWNLVWLSYNAFIEKYGTSWLTLLHVSRELILYSSPNCVFITIQTSVKAVGWEFQLKQYPNNRNKQNP